MAESYVYQCCRFTACRTLQNKYHCRRISKWIKISFERIKSNPLSMESNKQKKNFKGNIWEKHISKAEAHSKTSQPSEVKLCLNAVNNLKQFTSTNILSYKMKLFCGYSWQLWVFNYFHTKLLFRCLIYRCTAWKVFKYGVWSLFSRIWTEYIYSRMCSECTSEKYKRKCPKNMFIFLNSFNHCVHYVTILTH